jgi:hypothetical protein
MLQQRVLLQPRVAQSLASAVQALSFAWGAATPYGAILQHLANQTQFARMGQ